MVGVGTIETPATEPADALSPEVPDPTGTPLLVVDGRFGEVLVPLAETICRRIDVAAKVIEIDPPGGLVELNETKRSRPQDGTRDDD